MKKRSAYTIIVVAVLLAISGLFLYHYLTPSAYGIGDKIEIRVPQRLTNDSILKKLQQIDAEMAELRYYLDIHNVQDEGYQMIAQYNTRLKNEKQRLQKHLQNGAREQRAVRVMIKSYDRPMVAVKTMGGYWRAGLFHFLRPLNGKAIMKDSCGRSIRGEWDADTIVNACRTDSFGIYYGQFNSMIQADGEGVYYSLDGSRYEGLWKNDKRHGFGFSTSPCHHVRVGEWKNDKFLGEKLAYTSERIYGIDISRHQHEKGRRRFSINWSQLRINYLGSKNQKHVTGAANYPVSFIYIKATEGISIVNRYYPSDYQQARKRGIHVGAYHFFSVRTGAAQQAQFFLKHANVKHSDFPPVLDVEPTNAQIEQMGGAEELFKRIRVWMNIVESATGMRPILYVSQSFVNKYMNDAPDIKQKYQVWIARYGEYKPDVKLVFWQLTSDGHVQGIHGEVDINVFNGYQGQFDDFVRQKGYK